MVTFESTLYEEIDILDRKISSMRNELLVDLLNEYGSNMEPSKIVPIEKTIAHITQINNSELYPRDPNSLELSLKHLCIYLASTEYNPEYNLTIIHQLDKIKTRSRDAIKIKTTTLEWFSRSNK